MKILVYGAGPLGSIIAAKLHEGGHEVAILARGQRLADLREHGILLHDVATDAEIIARVAVVERLAPNDAYDVILVVMRKNNALDILPILAANAPTPNVLFLMNNAAGPARLVEALGHDRVLIGFPGTAGYREDPVVHGWTGTAAQPVHILFGEVDGRVTARTRRVARAFAGIPGLTAEIRTDMDAWLKYHVALLMPSLAPALYMCGTDHRRLARTRDAVVLAVRAMREGVRVLQALGLPVTPPRYRWLLWLPEPLLVALFQRLLADERMEVALVRHAEAARAEIRHLADEFRTLARATPVPTPTIERLAPHLDPDATPMPEGRADIPLNWRGVWIIGAVLAAVLAGVTWLLTRRPGGMHETAPG